jgi:hypothetical protein
MSSIGIHEPEKDLWAPRPAEGERWDPHTMHTHYFGFSIPEEQIGAFIYLRWQPSMNSCNAGVSIFRGTENMVMLDAEHLDYEAWLDWPEVEGSTITTANGLRIEFTEPGSEALVSYSSAEEDVSFELTARAVTPLLQRGHVLPSEGGDSDDDLEPGGSEQMMHMTGELVLHGERLEVDCTEARDRSWSQVRSERPQAIPPLGWSPMYFGPDLAFNQIGIEPLDTDPAWKGLFEVPNDRPSFNWGWVLVDGEPRELESVRRNVFEYHPRSYAAMRQEIDATDDQGESYHFEGETIAAVTVPGWHNMQNWIHVTRWTDEQGRESHSSFQEIWFATYQRAMHRRALEAASLG